MSVNTVMKVIYETADRLKEPTVPKGCDFEVDEIKAYGKKRKKEIWGVYGVERKTRKVIGICTGKRI